MKNARNMPQLNLRLPEHIKEWIKERAEANHRSINSEAVCLFEQCKQQEEKQNAARTA